MRRSQAHLTVRCGPARGLGVDPRRLREGEVSAEQLASARQTMRIQGISWAARDGGAFDTMAQERRSYGPGRSVMLDI